MEDQKSKIDILYEELVLCVGELSQESIESSEKVEKMVVLLKDIRLLATEKDAQVFLFQ